MYLYQTPPQINQNEQVHDDEMNRTCSTHGSEEPYNQEFGGKARRKETAWKT
jgi:hypothetical protein